MKKYIVYKTTNLINDKIYIGVHGTTDLNDIYLGSGQNIQRAIKKYGRHNFKKSILFITSFEDHAYYLESRLVTEKFICRRDVYNIRLGGRGWVKTKKQRDELIKRMKENNPSFNMSDETKRNISKAKIGKSSGALGIRKIEGDGRWEGTSHKGKNNPRAKHILIFDNNDEIVHECKGTFHTTLIEFNLPLGQFRKSLKTGVKVGLNLKHTREDQRLKILPYIGWYVTEIIATDSYGEEHRVG